MAISALFRHKITLKDRHAGRQIISLHEAENLSLEAIGAFVEASVGIKFEGVNRRELYGWVERLLGQHESALQGKAARGSVAALRREDDRLESVAANAAD